MRISDFLEKCRIELVAKDASLEPPFNHLSQNLTGLFKTVSGEKELNIQIHDFLAREFLTSKSSVYAHFIEKCMQVADDPQLPAVTLCKLKINSHLKQQLPKFSPTMQQGICDAIAATDLYKGNSLQFAALVAKKMNHNDDASYNNAFNSALDFISANAGKVRDHRIVREDNVSVEQVKRARAADASEDLSM